MYVRKACMFDVTYISIHAGEIQSQLKKIMEMLTTIQATQQQNTERLIQLEQHYNNSTPTAIHVPTGNDHSQLTTENNPLTVTNTVTDRQSPFLLYSNKQQHYFRTL